jgi:hypothetical protein
MEQMPPIDKATPSNLRIAKIEEHKEIIQVNIEKLTEVNKEVLEEYFLTSTKIIKMTWRFIK